MTFAERADVGYMLRTTAELARENAALVLAAIAIMTAINVAEDRVASFTASSLPGLLASLLFEYQLTLSALTKRGFVPAGRRARFWALLGLVLLSGIGILIGLVLLVIPGIYLAVRWSVCVPVLVAEERGVFESLTRSREEVRGRFWPVLGVSAVFWATVFLVGGTAEALMPQKSVVGSAVASLVTEAGLVGYWLAAVAIYIAGRSEPRLAEVFA